jgi:hypothetical protein
MCQLPPSGVEFAASWGMKWGCFVSGSMQPIKWILNPLVMPSGRQKMGSSYSNKKMYLRFGGKE